MNSSRMQFGDISPSGSKSLPLLRDSKLMERFINIDHTLSIAGQGLHAALNASRGNDRFHEPLTVIIELHRFGSLYGYRIGGEYRSGGPVGEDETEFSSSMLILRCLSVLPLNLRVCFPSVGKKEADDSHNNGLDRYRGNYLFSIPLRRQSRNHRGC